MVGSSVKLVTKSSRVTQRWLFCEHFLFFHKPNQYVIFVMKKRIEVLELVLLYFDKMRFIHLEF